MKQFSFKDLPENLQAIVIDLPMIQVDDTGGAEFKVLTSPNPEWGNMHVPLAVWLIKHGANKGEIVYLKELTDAID